MPLNEILKRAAERLVTPKWPYRWLALESAEVAAAYREMQRIFWSRWLPLVIGFALLLQLCRLAGFSEATFALRVSLGLMGATILFFLVPAFLSARFCRTLIAYWRTPGVNASRRLKVFTIAMIISICLQVLCALVLLGLAFFLIAGSTAT